MRAENHGWERAKGAMSRSLDRFRARSGDGISGVIAVELGILAPAFVLMIVCTLDLGVGIYRKMQVQNAAQAGAQYAMAHGFSSSSVSTAVTSATALSSISASPAPSQFCGCLTNAAVISAPCSSTCADGSIPGTYVTVSSQSTYNTILSYPLIPNSFTFTAQSTVRIK